MTNLAFSLSCEVLLEPLVLLLRGVVGGEEEGDGVPNDSLVMEWDGAGLTHCSQQTGLTISPSDVAHVLLNPLVQAASHPLTASDATDTIQGPASPRLGGCRESEVEGHAEKEGGTQISDGN